MYLVHLLHSFSLLEGLVVAVSSGVTALVVCFVLCCSVCI
jgi:hypothetical protein